MRQNLYVYFKLDGQPRTEIQRALTALHDELRARFDGVHIELLRRRDDADTWMEVYAGIRDASAFSNALHVGLSTCGVTRYGLSRHEEWFVPLD